MATKSTNINPRIIEIDDKAISPGQNKVNGDSLSFTLDREWAKQAFLVTDTDFDEQIDKVNRYWSSANSKYIDSRPGANFGINARPQFTRYSDVRVKGILSERSDVSLSSTKGNYGLGRYYSEAIDDPAQIIYMSFGVPQFNSLTNFLSKAFDPNMNAAARTGRSVGMLYQIGKAAGTVGRFIAFPAISLTIAAATVVNSFFVRPTSKFYTMKPTMHNYWSAVNTLLQTVAINQGIFPKIMNSDQKQKQGEPYKLDQGHLDAISNLIPDIFRDNQIDMYSVANKAQRLANQLFENEYNALKNGTATDYFGYVKKTYTGNGTQATTISDKNGNATLAAHLNRIASFKHLLVNETDTRLEQDIRIDAESKTGQVENPGYFKEAIDHADANFRDGSQYAIFKVDHTGSVSESFANSTIESELSQKLNSTSSTMRSARFNFAEGSLGEGGIGGLVSSALGGVADLALGILDGVSFNFGSLLLGLGGSGYIDIPKYWQSSSVSLPRANYTIQLISPYGNPISRLLNIYMPLCMLLAGALPLSTGKQSYTSPFLCQIFDKGRCQVRLGMIESLNITRGTSNLPFNLKGAPLAIDVSFSVVDMSSIMHMPISTATLLDTAKDVLAVASGGVFDGSINMTLDEDNILSDYLSVLSGQDIYSQIYPMAKAKLNAAKRYAKGKATFSPAAMASLFHESSTSGMLQYVTFGAFNALELVARGNTVLTR